MSKIWVVTKEINAYDQDGEYFIAAYKEKPTFKQLKELLPHRDDVTIGKLIRGGGRHEWEDEWYYLREIEEGTKL